MRVNVIVTLQVEGIHQWKNCPLMDVYFLKHPHRHIFHITAKKAVSHDDREVEIIMLKRALLLSFQADHDRVVYFGSQSCEMIATKLLVDFQLEYCSVLEDNENGAEVWAK